MAFKKSKSKESFKVLTSRTNNTSLKINNINNESYSNEMSNPHLFNTTTPRVGGSKNLYNVNNTTTNNTNISNTSTHK